MQQINKIILTRTAKALDRMIGSSSLIKPYHTQSERPVMSTRIIVHERSSAFFSFKTFINCGIIDTEVKTPAIIPSRFSSIFYLLIKIIISGDTYNDYNTVNLKSVQRNFFRQRNIVFYKIVKAF